MGSKSERGRVLGAHAPIDRTSVGSQAYGHLKDILMRGDLQPGQRLVLRDVARELGISVTPVREALLQLVAERILSIGANGMIIVPRLSLSECEELWQIRLLLEGQCAEVGAMKSTARTLDAMKRAQDGMARAKQDRRLDDALSFNIDFHFALYKAAEMPLMLEIIESTWARSATYVHYFQHHHVEKRNVSAKQGPHVHNTILKAVAANDGPAARRGIERDLLEIRNGIMRLLEESHSATDNNIQTNVVVARRRRQ